MFINSNPAWVKTFSHPKLPLDVLITLAVINLDPDNRNGVPSKKIVTFLSLYFPYYNRQQEECRKLVRMAQGQATGQEAENKSFKIKSILIPRLMERMNKYMNKNR
jgi:hypothetical protein